jgi:serine/threonine-protein kinase
MTIVALLALSALWIGSRSTRPDARALVRLDVDLGADVLLGSQFGTDVIISRDGSRLVWVSEGRLFTRRLDQPKAVELGSGGAPFFSPDGQWIAFGAGNTLRKVSVAGGATITLCEWSSALGATWGEDGRIVASIRGTLSTIPDAGGTPTPLTTLLEGDPADGEHAWPQILPGGRAVLFTVRPRIGSFDDARIDALSLRDGRRKTLQRGGAFGRYLAAANGDGHLLYVNKGTLFAVPFDVDRLETSGAPSPVLEGVGYSSTNGSAQFDASRTGTLVYRGGNAGDSLVSLQWLDAAGKTQLLPAKPAGYTQPRLSPDGSLIALTVAGGGGQDLWVYDWQRDIMKRLTFGARGFKFHVWSPDGRYIVFTEEYDSTGLFWTRADGAGGPQPLTQSKLGQVPVAFSPDGKRLIFREFRRGLFTVPVQNEGGGLKAGQPEMFLQIGGGFADLSRDGHWIAYATAESGTNEIQVRAFPDNGSKWSVSDGRAVLPIWSPNGRELFYRTSDQRIMVVTYTVKGDVFVADKPRLWSERRLAAIVGGNLDIAPDGKRFVVTMPVDAPDEQKAVNHVTFLQNFSDEVRRRVGATK